MDTERPNNLGKTIEVRASSRPVKIAYLVPYEESPVSHMIVDAVFYESYTRWAGAFTLIVPTSATNFLDPAYDEWLEFFDPDIVYTYVELEVDMVNHIDKLCSPIALLSHKSRTLPPSKVDWRTFIGDFHSYVQPVSSITTIESPQAQRQLSMQLETESEITVLTQYHTEPQNRVLSDNFGTAFHINLVTHAVPGLYRTLCLVPHDLPGNVLAGSERCFSVAEAISAIGSRKAMPVAKYAMAHSEAIPKVESHLWSHTFRIFVGGTLLDRLHFWNSRHFTSTYATTPGALVLGKEFFEDDPLLTSLGEYLNRNNFLGQGSGQCQVSIHSYSHTEEELRLIRDNLGAHTYNSVFVNKEFNAPVIPTKRDLEHRYLRGATTTTTSKLTEDSNTLLAEEPAHFFFISPRLKGKAQGQWIVELDIQRHNNLSKYSNVVDSWVLPRRRKIVRAFTRRLGKVTIGGRLALLPATENLPFRENPIRSSHQFEVFLPSDEEFFRHLALDFYPYAQDDLRSSMTRSVYEDISISDKGQNLRGVISMFDSLSDAYEILTNKFWREVLRAGKEDSAKSLVFERNALNGFLPSDRVTKEKLMKELNLPDIGVVTNFMNSNLTDTLEYLVRANVFYQVYQWRCQYCGHTNSRNFDGMKIRNSCDICETNYFAPIDLEWTYEINDFIFRSLTKHNGLPVLWTLGFLQDWLGRNGFWYLTEVDLFEKHDDQEKKSEMDILCVLGGKYYVVEVKTTASLFLNKPGEMDKFIQKINQLKPDVAMLSFERYCESGKDPSTTKALFEEASVQISEKIDSNIAFEVIVADEIKGFNEYPPDLGRFGKRSQTFH